nr:MAG TPA: PROTEIN/RNA Complex, archaeal, ribosomal, 50S, protein.0A [Caudoviricetes sp.]
MAEYFDREALLLRIDCHGTNKFGMLDEDIRAFVKAQPAADVAPVVHGRWIKGSSNPYCSECFVECRDETPFCPNCGAKMGGGNS